MKAKKILASLIATVMVLSTMVCPAFADGKVAYIGDIGYETLANAIAAANGNTTITVSDGTHTMPNISDKDIVIKGGKNAVIEMLGVVRANGSTVEFDGVTVKFDNDMYEGLQTPDKLVYKNCTHIGTEFLYAPTVSYTGCTFEMYDNATEYAVWTYGAKDVTFNDCVFNTHGKAILVYNEWTTNDYVANIKLADCIFYSDKTVATDKAAVEMGKSGSGGVNTYNITFDNCTADTFSTNNSTSPLWGDKNNMVSGTDEESATGIVGIAVDGEVIVEEEGASVSVATVGEKTYASLQAAIDAAGSDAEIKLLTDVTIDAEDGKPETHAWVKGDDDVIIDLNGNTVTGAFFINGIATIKNGTITNNSYVSGIETQGNLTLEDMTITSDRHAVRVSGGTTTIKNGTYQTVASSGTAHAVNASGGETVLVINGGEFYGAGKANLGAKGNCVMDQGIKSAIIEGGKFYGANGIEGPICAASNTVIKGGEFEDAAVNAWRYTAQTAEGCWAFQKYDNSKKNVFFVDKKKEVPKATIEKIDNPTVTVDGIGNVELESAYNFIAPHKTGEEALASQYSTWHADFVVSVDKDIPAQSIVLAGQYDSNSKDWLAFTNPEPITAGTEIRLLKLYSLSMNYYELCTLVQEFKCGVADVKDALDGTNFTVELRMYEVNPYSGTNTTWNDEKTNSTPVVSNKVVYEIGSDKAPITWATATDAGYFMDGETKKGLMRYLFNVTGMNISEIGVESTMGSKKTSKIETLVTGESDITFGVDFIFAEAEEKNYTLKGYAKIGEEMNYSPEVTNTPDWTKLLNYGGNK